MAQANYLTWENFAATVFVRGERRMHRVSEDPRIDILADGIADKIGVVVALDKRTEVPSELTKLAFINVRVFESEGQTLLEASTDKPFLHHEFYHLLTAAAERVLTQAESPIDAMTAELTAFAELLEERSTLGIQREIGLLGELLFLQELVSRGGISMLDSWLGPTAEPHDFRIAAREFEVKTTTSPQRIHTINGSEQLLPSSGCDLILVSIVLGPPGQGTGFSLSEIVQNLVEIFATDASSRERFARLLAACNFVLSDSSLYKRAFVLRRPIAIVPVDSAFPSITRPDIQQILGPLATRVREFRYDVSVEGLEHELGSDGFESALLFDEIKP